MSRKKDENNATVIIFLFILVCCALAFGWVVGSIIAVLSLIAMCMGET